MDKREEAALAWDILHDSQFVLDGVLIVCQVY